jgi:putative methyltransferase (TIGR04325 family)
MLPEQAVNVIVSVGIAATNILQRPLTVLDFGGGCGTHYFTAVARFRTPFKWAIVETSPMAKGGAEISQGRFETYSEIEAAGAALGHIDLVFASGSIQYVPDPFETLSALVSLGPRYFAIARFPVWRGPQIVGLQTSLLSQNGIGPMPPSIRDRHVTHPVTFVDYETAMRAFKDYELLSVTDSPSATYIVQNRKVGAVSLVFGRR